MTSGEGSGQIRAALSPRGRSPYISQGAAASASTTGAADGPPPSSPMLDQMNQLAALHQQGVLTDDEFSAAKARLSGT
jgi:Short C-terminal domain